MTSDAPSFEGIGLPGDLWIEVALDADPLDVVSLSQTCRILHSLLSEVSVWRAILREVMRRNGPFMVSYSLDELTLDELQRAATRSERWRRFSIKRALSPGTWNMETTLETGKLKSLRDCSDAHPTNAYNLTQRLIPGGRFLLTSGVSKPDYEYDGESTAQMTLWDLGPHNSHPGLKSIPVASSVVARGFPPFQRVRLDVDLCVADETRLTIAASFSAGSEGARTTTVFGLDLQSQERRFNVVGTINYKDDYRRMTLVDGPNVLLVDSTGFILWNYVDSRASCWRSPLPPGGADLRDTFVNESYVVSIVSDGVQAWDISQLDMRPDSELDSSIAAPIEPHLFLSAPWWPVPEGTRAVPTKLGIAPATATNSGSGSFLFDVVVSYGWSETQQLTNVFRYELHLAKNRTAIEGVLTLRGAGHYPGEDFSVLIWPLASICEAPEKVTNDMRYYLYHLVDPCLPEASSTPVIDVSSKTPLLLTVLDSGKPVAFCPLAGRLLYLHITGNGPWELRKWICVDYIS